MLDLLHFNLLHILFVMGAGGIQPVEECHIFGGSTMAEVRAGYYIEQWTMDGAWTEWVGTYNIRESRESG